MQKRVLLGIGSILILTTFFGAGLLCGRLTGRPEAPVLNDPQVWLPIKVFHGTITPDGGNVDVIISAIFRLSDDRYPFTVMQNKIEIKGTNGQFSYLWPDDKSFVAGWCDVRDVDGDGMQEFLMYAGAGSLRIVSFTNGKFQFRPSQDELISFEDSVGPSDLDGDGKLEFLEAEHFPSTLDIKAKWIWIPRVKRWSRANGFVDVSKQYAKYYQEKVIPQLRQRLKVEQDPEIAKAISQGVEFIKREISGG